MKYSYYPGCAQHGTAVDYRSSVEAVFGRLGIELEEVKNWNCCGALHVPDRTVKTGLSARTLHPQKGLIWQRHATCAIQTSCVRKSRSRTALLEQGSMKRSLKNMMVTQNQNIFLK